MVKIVSHIVSIVAPNLTVDNIVVDEIAGGVQIVVDIHAARVGVDLVIGRPAEHWGPTPCEVGDGGAHIGGEHLGGLRLAPVLLGGPHSRAHVVVLLIGAEKGLPLLGAGLGHWGIEAGVAEHLGGHHVTAPVGEGEGLGVHELLWGERRGEVPALSHLQRKKFNILFIF